MTKQKKRSRSRSRPSKGWKSASPKRGTARKSLYKRCGSKCFLLPQQLKFPICPANSKSCSPDCRGLLAAYIRAQQYKYHSVAKKAVALAKKSNCSWVKNKK